MFPRLTLALLLVLATAAAAQPTPLTVCLVQTKPDAATQYEPSAGPWAVAIDKQLSAQKLSSGAPLHITVLAASTQKDLLPEVRRLQCPWVIQLWYQRTPDITLNQNDVSTDGQPPHDPHSGFPTSVDHDDTVLFALWNGVTEKVTGRGAAPLRLLQSQAPPDPVRANPLTCAALTQQIIRRLNKLP